MIECWASWFIIFISAYLWGNAGLSGLEKISKERIQWKIDDRIIAGMCMLTVYAQTFSIFYKVGAVAFGMVMTADITCLYLFRAQLLMKIENFIKNKNRYITYAVFVCVAIVVGGIETSVQARHPDTTLYHAQSIRWIEEYGVINGLGNLHNRLAYNSAFFSFQALFSFAFMLGKSLHTANGLIAVVFTCYAICSAKAWKDKKIQLSDFMRLSLLLWILSNISVFSSPGSDMLPVGLVLYIMCKWISYGEEHESQILPYAELCFVAVWAVSVKLSASFIVLLTVYPAVKLLRNRKIKKIMMYILIGIGIIAPFLVRNVIISGYLIYPYPELDLFDVDWKMPAYTLLFDRNEITAWGRGLRDVFRFDEPFRVWFPVWYETLGSSKKWFWLAAASACAAILKSIYGLICALRKCDRTKLEEILKYILVVLTMILCTLGWFIGSPLPRYGIGYLYMLSMFGIGGILLAKPQNELLKSEIVPLLFAFVLGMSVNSLDNIFDANLLRTPDYDMRRCDEVNVGKYTFYVPYNGYEAGYWAFPSIPYIKIFDLIEPRGDTFGNGFRMKKEYRDAFITNMGVIYDENIFDKSN